MPEPTLSPASAPTPPNAAPNAAEFAVDEDVTTSLYRAAIGPVSTAFYLPIFARFEAAERAGLSWNTAASLLTFNWLVYRQLWGAALGYAGILATVALLVFGIGRLVFQMSDTLTMALCLGFGLAAFVLPGLFGTALFQKECRKRMGAALAAHAVLAEACQSLQRQSSSRLRILWVALSNVAVLGIVAFVSIQVSNLSTLAVMPPGALDPSHVETGLGAKTAGTLASASAVSAAASAALPVSSAATAATSTASSAAAASPSELATSAPMSAASVPLAVASAPAVITPAPTAKPETIEVSLPSPATATAAAKTPLTAKAEPKAASKATTTAEPKAEAKTSTKEVTKPQAATSKKAVKEVAKPQVVIAKLAPPSKPTAAPELLFYINVGLFSKPQNAARVHAQLLEAKLPSVMTELKTVKDRQIRVRVGPFSSEMQAEAAAEKIRALKFDAGIIQQ